MGFSCLFLGISFHGVSCIQDCKALLWGSFFFISPGSIRFLWFKPVFLLLPGFGFPALFMNAHLAPTPVHSSVWNCVIWVVISCFLP